MFSSKFNRILNTCQTYSKICFSTNATISSRRLQTSSRHLILGYKRPASVRATSSLSRQIHLSSALLTQSTETSSTEENVATDTEESTEESVMQERFLAYMSGIPWSATIEDVTKFLSDCNLKNGEDSIIPLASYEGKFSGNAYLEFASQEDLEKALAKDMNYIKHRFIRIDTVTAEKMEARLSNIGTVPLSRNISGEDNVVMLRGLPYRCSEKDIRTFFEGIEIAEDGIAMLKRADGRILTKGHVKFASREDYYKAMERDKEYIGNRYIEVFPSSEEIFNKTKAAQSNWKSMGSDSVRMEGLPWSTTEADITEFFAPLKCERIEIIEDKFGRSRGIAMVQFASDEVAEQAMKKDKEYIYERYVELTRIPKRNYTNFDDVF